jgi:hypothetical protein
MTAPLNCVFVTKTGNGQNWFFLVRVVLGTLYRSWLCFGHRFPPFARRSNQSNKIDVRASRFRLVKGVGIVGSVIVKPFGKKSGIARGCDRR